jgi:hypothetical protein
VNRESFKNHPHPHLLPSREKETHSFFLIIFSLAPLWERSGEGIFSSSSGAAKRHEVNPEKLINGYNLYIFIFFSSRYT